MNEPKFTKGPWKAVDDVMFDIRRIRIKAAGYPWRVANVADSGVELMLKAARQEMDWNVFAANAHLMAAAPEMYVILQKILNINIIPDYQAHIAQEIIRILQKARGEA